MLLAHRDRRGRRVRRPGRRHRRPDSALRQDQADRQPARLPQDARRTSRRSTAGWPGSTPTSSRSPRMANHPHDNLRMLRLVRRARCRRSACAWATSASPRGSWPGKFGAPFTYATFHHERALAPGPAQLPADDRDLPLRPDQRRHRSLRRDRRPDRPQPQPADPQRRLPRTWELNKVYVPFRVPREDLAQFIDDAPRAGHQGAERHHSAQGRGAQEAHRGRRRGPRHRRGQHASSSRATDGSATTPTTARPWTAWKRPWSRIPRTRRLLHGKTALVLGAGGVGKAIAYGLVRRGADVVVASRTAPRAESLAKQRRLQGRRMGRPAHRLGRRAGQLHAGGHAPQRRRNALRQAPPAPVDDRLRRRLQSREHAAGQGRPQPQLHGRHRRRHVRPPGGVQFKLFTGPRRRPT